MKYYSTKQNNKKIVIYAIVVAVLAGVCVIAMQDIKAPQEHVSQQISVNVK